MNSSSVNRPSADSRALVAAIAAGLSICLVALVVLGGLS